GSSCRAASSRSRTSPSRPPTCRRAARSSSAPAPRSPAPRCRRRATRRWSTPSTSRSTFPCARRGRGRAAASLCQPPRRPPRRARGIRGFIRRRGRAVGSPLSGRPVSVWSPASKMSRTKRSRPRGFTAVFAACGALAALLLLGTGCEEITSRREIQKGNRLYLEGRYRNAIEMYESALARTPDLDIGQHNAGLAYYKMFQPGLETPENKQMAEKAAAHFQPYLKQNPGDRKVISLLSTIWLASGQYEKALAYWSDVLAKNPDSRDVIEKLANINRQAGQYDKALEWHMKRAEME